MSDRRTSPQMIAVDHDDDEVDDSFLRLMTVFFVCTMVMMLRCSQICLYLDDGDVMMFLRILGDGDDV